MQRFGLKGQLFLGIMGAVTVCMIICAVATYSVFESVLLNIKDSHFRFVVNDVRTSISNLTALGLPLSSLQRSQDIIDKIHSRDPEIGSITIFGATGEIFYSTDTGDIGSTAAPDWLSNAKAGAEAGAQGDAIRSVGRMVAVAPLANPFGDFAGGVALQVGATGLPLQLEEGGLLLAGLSIASLFLTAIGAWLSVKRAFGGLAEGLKQGASYLEALVNGHRNQPSPELPDWLGVSYERYTARARRTLKLLDRAMASAARVDEHR
ncbi:MAG: hypothetical protein WCF85_16895 [Rhodospirillaceae bacterium]